MNEKRRLNDRLLSSIAEQQAQIIANQVQNQEPTPDDKETINTINELANFFNFDKFIPNETFEIPGLQLRNGKYIKIYVKEDDITNIADQAEKYEKLLGIKFPAQIYQYQTKNLGATIPGTKTPIPRPKLVTETNDDYEKYLKNIYTNEGILTKPAPDKIGRSPYPHEHIDFKRTQEEDSTYYSEYYLNYQNSIRIQNLRSQVPPTEGPKRTNNRIQRNERLTVKDSELVGKTPLGQKIGKGLTTMGSITANPNFWTKLKVGVASAVIVTALGFGIYANPALAAAIAVGAVSIGGGIFLGKKIKNAISRKINNWLYGKPIEINEDYDDEDDYEESIIKNNSQKKETSKEQETRTKSNTQSPDDDTKVYTPEEPNVSTTIPFEPYDPNEEIKIYPHGSNNQATDSPENNNTIEYESFINETAQTMKNLKDIRARITVVKESLDTYTSATPEYHMAVNDLMTLTQQENELVSMLETLINDVIPTEEVNKGGKNL